ncbi:MAG TPA: hypothetical protein VGM01_09405, partial [Ktedonobacteraceae bacterium]
YESKQYVELHGRYGPRPEEYQPDLKGAVFIRIISSTKQCIVAKNSIRIERGATNNIYLLACRKTGYISSLCPNDL